MSPRVIELRDEVLALPPEDRAGLVIDLLDSLDGRPPASDADQLADAGHVELDSWDDLMAKVARSLNPE